MNFNVFHLLRPFPPPTPYPLPPPRSSRLVHGEFRLTSPHRSYPAGLILAVFKRLLRSYIRHIILNIPPPQLTSVFLDIRAIS